MNHPLHRRATRRGRSLRAGAALAVRGLVVGALGAMAMPAFSPNPVSAASVTSAVFTGGSGTVTVGGTLYAKQGGALTLTVATSSDTKCVDVSGSLTGHQQSSTAQSSWTFTFAAPSGNGSQAITAAASPNFNGQNKCTGNTGTMQASFLLDNTGPSVSATLTPAANAAGWNNTNTAVAWSATDAGAGVASGPTPASSNETNGVNTRTSTATDRLGNTGAGSVTVRIDKAPPTITAQQTANADGTTTVTFTCADSTSGIAGCVADGSSPASNSRTVAGGTTVTGTAIDVAGNTATASSTAPIRDAIAPTITSTVTPAPNADGWNKGDATVTFSCTDNAGGSGIKSCVANGTSPASASTTVSAETNGTLVGGTATDNADNVATASVTVKLDETEPTVTASRSPAPNAAGWNNSDVTVSFECGDALAGVKTCPAAVTRTEGANQAVTGTATDNADNTSAEASVTGINIDTTAPVLTGTWSSGWHTGDVTVDWSCTDTLSGPAAQPAADVVTGEGSALSSTATCTDVAGNSTTRTVSGIAIDRTAPTTGIGGTSNDWTNGDVTVTLTPADNLSGVGTTTYTVDGGAPQTGTSFTLSAEGDHAVTFFSTDVAGNAEAVQSAHVKIDRTAPTIGHRFTPLTYTDGAWTNQDVTVTFECVDQGGSGVAGCTAPVTTTTEGQAQQVTGTATDGAGNTATDTAIVSIDKTAPVITAATDRPPNAAGWYADDVTVSYTAGDELSGVSGTPESDVLAEGADQSANATVTDAAGNSASAGMSGINIDKTAPVVSGTFNSGWHTGDVTVDWSCTDALSGPAAQPADGVVTGEGADLSSTASCTDAAGNTTTQTVDGIQIDRTTPATGVSVSGTLDNGWYAAGVSVELTATDNLSGVDTTYVSVDGATAQVYSTAVSITADGTHTVTFWSTDRAGNVEDPAGNTITLHIDTTAPTLTGHPTTSPNGNGWYAGDVTVHWTCADATSGIDGDCPADSVVGGEGGNLGASGSVRDRAGNSVNANVTGINIDRTDPTTTASVPAPPASGWYRNAVTVTLSGHDNLSGIAATYYTVDGGAPQSYSSAFSYGTEGTHEIAFWSVDEAGNVETAGAPVTLSIDKTAPVTTVVNPISPASGWFVTSGIPFAFDAADETSGVAATYYTIDGGEPRTYGLPFSADLSTGSHSVTYWSVDIAGNTEAEQSLTVRVDTIAPTITGSQTPAANAAGWNNTAVDVTFACTDADSGIDGVAGCAGATTLANEGAGQTVHGDAVDVAGNRSSTDYGPVNIDTTKPTLVGVPPDPNGAGWYKSDVTVIWVGDDALSGIDPASQPAPTTITGEGPNLGAGPVAIADKAGNIADPASVSGIKIDRTAPVIGGAPVTSPNAAGWYTGEVVVDFTCTDNLSGVATCPTSTLLKGDGANQSVTSDPATDIAGNVGTGKAVGGINIDGTAPSSTSNNQCTSSNGWCTGPTASVALSATDQAGLSGVKEIHYSIAGGAEQVSSGATKTVVVPLDGSGAGTVVYWAVDHAGNVEAPNTVALKWDNIAPTVSHTLSPAPNAEEWNNADVTVTFTAKDDDKGSGVAAVSAPVHVSTETAGQVVTGTASDTVGNTGTDSVTVKLDKTKPTITGAVTSGTKTASGWYSGPVTVTFTCADVLSGLATCPDPMVLSANGANTAAGTATDKAGNTATATVSGINIDQEKPTLTTAGVNVQGGTYTLGAVPTATCTATDSFSGLASCRVTVSGGNANGVGTFTYHAVATDRTGNTSVVTGTYRVIYRFDGFLQPINDTAHQVGVSTSVFKAGSTVPTKFQLKNSAGQVVQTATAAAWLTPLRGGSLTAPVDETSTTVGPDSGALYRYDAAAQQYIYNWKTGSGGNYWRIGVTLDDGQTYFVNIGLR